MRVMIAILALTLMIPVAQADDEDGDGRSTPGGGSTICTVVEGQQPTC